MHSVLQRHAEKVIGMLNGWDRIRLRGTLRWVASLQGMRRYLYAANGLLKDFKDYAQRATEEIRQATIRTTDATSLLNRIAKQANPARKSIFGQHSLDIDYYWSVEESEWASDILFRSAGDLKALYPRLIRHGMQTMGSADVMRFLGRKVPQHGGVDRRFLGQVVTDLKDRPEGMRIKHRLNRNAIKMYDKQTSVLRVETTINDARDVKVYRTKESRPKGGKSWQPLRKGIADVHRRAQISQAANERYLDSMAVVEDGIELGELASQLSRPAQWEGRRVRALNPFSVEDAKLLAAVNRGEFTINGFRNRDLYDPSCLGVAK